VDERATDKVREAIVGRDLIPRGGHVVVGFSGGPDSMCLFHILLRLREEFEFTVSAVHVNHGFRPGAADDDQSRAEKLCADWGAPLDVRVLDVAALAREWGETQEEAGRTARYRAFDEAALDVERRTGIPRESIKVAVAHNRNDQAETVLMRFLRGSGPDGLAGMPFRRVGEAGYDVIRPLLAADRVEIEAYCASRDLEPAIDHTNEETRYHRNRIRLKLLPLLREDYNASVDDAILRLARIAEEDRDFFDAAVREIIAAECRFFDARSGSAPCSSARIALPALAEARPAIRHRLIIAIFKDLGLAQDIETAHIEAADRLIESGKTGKSIDFPSGYSLEISYNFAIFAARRASDTPDETHTLEMETLERARDMSISFRLFDLRFRVVTFVPKRGTDARGEIDAFGFEGALPCDLVALRRDSNALVLDFDSLREDADALTLRTRRPGDRIAPEGMTGGKKIQDLFVDMKLPKNERERIVLVAAGDDILWVPGKRKTRKYATGENTRRALIVCLLVSGSGV
jgi:tRNA(Ile)-lysidine synthase